MVIDMNGHVGFIGGSVQQPEYYLEKRIPEFIASLLKQWAIIFRLKSMPHRD